MGRNNNNAGMHFVNHSHYGSDDDLSYYDKHSSEYLTNRAYEARAELDAMGEYDFLSYCGIIKIKKEDVDYDDWSIYTLRLFSSDHKKELLRVSTKYILLDNNLQEVGSDEVLVHDSNSLIYIDERDSGKIDKNKLYRLRKKQERCFTDEVTQKVMNKNTSTLYIVKEIEDRHAILVNDLELITVPKYQLPLELEVGQEIIRDLFEMYHKA